MDAWLCAKRANRQTTRARAPLVGVFIPSFILLSTPSEHTSGRGGVCADTKDIATCSGVLIVPDLQYTYFLKWPPHDSSDHRSGTCRLSPASSSPRAPLPTTPLPPPAGPSSHACPPYSFSSGGSGCCRRCSRAQPPGGAEPVPLAAAHPRGGAARRAARPRRPCTPSPALLCTLGAPCGAFCSFRTPAHELLT